MSDSWKIVLLCLIAGALAARIASRWIRRYRWRKRMTHARNGEKKALSLLRRRGFDILSCQPEIKTHMYVDGRRWTYALRADFLVRRGDKTYIAEVKTGKTAPRLSHAPTRRQILEYLLSYRVHGALLVNADTSQIREVTHYLTQDKKEVHLGNRFPIRYFMWGVVIGSTAMYLLRFFQKT